VALLECTRGQRQLELYPVPEIRLIVVDPGHFHAALLQKEMHPNVDARVHVYAPLGPDLLDYLDRVARFNRRADQPTQWELEVHAGPDFLARLTRERPGDVAIFSGRNRGKIQRIHAAIEAGLHVLADKPWVIRTEDMPLLETTLAAATRRGLVAFDMMTGRHDVMTALQRALHADPAVFGDQRPGTLDCPGVTVTSVHHILKQVAGAPNPRPAWFFDVSEQGEALSDVGTHLVDRAHGTLFPAQAVDHRTMIQIHAARRWPTLVGAAQFRQVTGALRWPSFLDPWINGDTLEYWCNNSLHYEVRGVHVALDLRWDWEAVAGGDTHTAVYRGSRATLELRQGVAERYRPELYVVPHADIADSLEHRIAALSQVYAGLDVDKRTREWRIVVPDSLRIGHDARFVQHARRFFEYVAQPHSLPGWEQPNMMAKYHICTHGVARATAASGS